MYTIFLVQIQNNREYKKYKHDFFLINDYFNTIVIIILIQFDKNKDDNIHKKRSKNLIKDKKITYIVDAYKSK